MKKFAMAVMIFTIFAIASASHAATTCSNKPVSATMSSIDLILDQYSPRAIVIVTIADKNGTPICNTKVNIKSDLNANDPKNGFAPGTVKIAAFGKGLTDTNGKAVFLLQTKGATGNTIFISARGTKLGPKEGLPFSFNDGK